MYSSPPSGFRSKSSAVPPSAKFASKTFRFRSTTETWSDVPEVMNALESSGKIAICSGPSCCYGGHKSECPRIEQRDSSVIAIAHHNYFSVARDARDPRPPSSAPSRHNLPRRSVYRDDSVRARRGHVSPPPVRREIQRIRRRAYRNARDDLIRLHVQHPRITACRTEPPDFCAFRMRAQAARPWPNDNRPDG